MAEQRKDKLEQGLNASLLHELEQVIELRVKSRAASGQSGSAMLLARLVEGLDQEDWKKLASDARLEHWLGIPLRSSGAQSLAAFQDTLEELVFQRDHDSLTGLPNRRFFDRHLGMELERAARTSSPLSLVMLDLDNFKRINDSYGHACGDVVLKRLGAFLRKAVRPYDIPARVGGEEFAIILPGVPLWKAQRQAERSLRGFREEIFQCQGAPEFSMTFSAGVAALPGNASADEIRDASAEKLMALADKALYEAKRQGKNIVLASESEGGARQQESIVRPNEKAFLFGKMDD